MAKEEPIDPEHWTPEILAERLSFIHKNRDYIFSISTETKQNPEHPSSIIITFRLLKKRGVTA